MSQCITCNKMYHPDYMVQIDEFDENSKKCAWCYTGKKEITIEKEGDESYTLTKNEATQSYHKYLNKLTQYPKIRKLMFQGKDNPLDALKG